VRGGTAAAVGHCYRMWMQRSLLVAGALALVAACSTGGDTDAGVDLGAHDAGRTDAGVDAGRPDGGVDAGATDGGVDAGATDGGVDAGACTFSMASTLDGVRFVFTGGVCRFTLAEAAAGITIPYDLVVDHDIAGVDPAAVSYSVSGDESPGPSGLNVFELLSGTEGSYCLCDVGLPAPPTHTTSTVRAGTYHSEFHWDGRNWNGPSDFGAPEGAPFPPGSYALQVISVGAVVSSGGSTDFRVGATLPIELVP